MPLLHLLMPGWSEHATGSVTYFALDRHTALFAAKKGIPTWQSIQLIDGLYHFRKPIPGITLFYKSLSTYSCHHTVTWWSSPSADCCKCQIQHMNIITLKLTTICDSYSKHSILWQFHHHWLKNMRVYKAACGTAIQHAICWYTITHGYQVQQIRTVRQC